MTGPDGVGPSGYPGRHPDVHPEDEELAAAASGEPVDDRLVDHVAGCTRCARRMEGLAVTASRLRSIGDDARTHGPSTAVWDAVHTATSPEGSPEGSPSTSPARSSSVGSVSPGAVGRRGVRAPWLVAAAAAGLVVGGAAVGLAAATSDGEPAPRADRPAVLGRADLDPVGAATARGAATLTAHDGRRRLTIDMEAPARVPPGHYVEAWLFDPATLDMVSVGVVDTDRVSLPVPADLDLDTYTGVDLSVEPLDADPAHATSLAQGPLR